MNSGLPVVSGRRVLRALQRAGFIVDRTAAVIICFFILMIRGGSSRCQYTARVI